MPQGDREGSGGVGVEGKGGSLQPGKRETDRGGERREAMGEGCMLVRPVPKARGECSVQQTA